MRSLTIIQDDWVAGLRKLPDQCVQCCVTSPPYWGLRDYRMPGQLGLERSPLDYVERLRCGFREVSRVLRDDGTVWLNLGDCYTSNGGHADKSCNDRRGQLRIANRPEHEHRGFRAKDRKNKELIGIPWLVAFALQADGWYLRSDIIWHKPNPMPESVKDRPTRSHEYIFLLTKRARYYYDHEAIKEPASPALVKQIEQGYNGSAIKDYLRASVQDASATKSRIIEGYRKRIDKQRGHGRRHAGFNAKWDSLSPREQVLLGRNKRSVWTVAPANFRGAHFATFPPKLIEPCILAGSRPGDLVLDPFGGTGTTGMVALAHGRKAVLIELNGEYVAMARERCRLPTPVMSLVTSPPTR